MLTPKLRRAALAVLTCTMVATPFAMSSATALSLPIPGGVLPPEVEAVVDEATAALPPEVTEAVDPLLEQTDPVVADVFAQLLTLDIQYFQQTSSEPGHSTAAAVEVPDLVIIGKSETTRDDARVTIVHVAGEDILTKEGTADGGEWGGTAAAAGEIVDAVHSGTCGSEDACVLIVPSSATTTEGYGTNSAAFSLVSIQAGEDGITLLPNTATTADRSLFGTDRCTDVATAFLATGSGQLASASLAMLVGPKIETGGILTPC